MLRSGHTETRWIARMILCLVLFAFNSVPLRAARPYTPVHPDPVPEAYRWRTYPQLEGRGLECLAQTPDSTLWFGVHDGVVRYDGETWRTYGKADGLSGSPISSLCVSGDGYLHAGTVEGVFRFDGQAWQAAHPLDDRLVWEVTDLAAAPDGGIWAATELGGLRLEGRTAALYTDGSLTAALTRLAPWLKVEAAPAGVFPEVGWNDRVGFRGRVGVVYQLGSRGPAAQAGVLPGDRILTADGDMIQWLRLVERDSLRLTVVRPGVADTVDLLLRPGPFTARRPEVRVGSLCVTQDGTVWFAMVAGSVVALRTGSNSPPSWSSYVVPGGLNNSWRLRIRGMADGSAWLVSGQSGQGVLRFDGSLWQAAPQGGFLGPNSHCSLAQTDDGAIWVGATNGRLLAFRGGTWSAHGSGSVPLPDTRISDLLQASDGALWLACRGRNAVRFDPTDRAWQTYDRLTYQCEGDSGSSWFVTWDSTVVVRNREAWTEYGVQDGLMDRPREVFADRSGTIWAAGSHAGQAALAFFSGGEWRLQIHPELGGEVGRTGVCVARDSTLWVTGTRATPGEALAIGRRRAGIWSVVRGPAWLPQVYGMVETADGRIWFGGKRLYWLADEEWHQVTKLGDMAESTWFDALLGTRNGQLWVGTRHYGAFHFSGGVWTRYDVSDGLPSNRIEGILETTDGSIWLSTGAGVCRFDGTVWASGVLPDSYRSPVMREDADGRVWAGSRSYAPNREAPETWLITDREQVTSRSDVLLAWRGADPWDRTQSSGITYSRRMNGGPWSAFSGETSWALLDAPSGSHRFEVRARDLDLNVDPTPALLEFTVLPPVWQQGWFIGMVLLFVTGIGLQSGRVVARGRRLRRANEELEARVAARTMDLTHSNRMLRTLSECNQALVREKDETKLMEEVCRVLVEDGGFRMAWVGLAENDDLKTIRPSAHCGADTGYAEGLALTWSQGEGGQGLSGRTIREGRTLVVQDTARDPSYGPWREQALRLGYASTVGLPLQWEGGTHGVLRVYSGEPGAFTDSETRLLEELAGDLAFGMVAARIRVAHQQADETLQEREAVHRGAIEAAGAVPYYRDFVSDAFDFVGEGIQDLVGHGPAEFTPELCRSITLEEVPTGIHKGLSLDEAVQLDRSGKTTGWRSDLRVRTRSGEERWLSDASRTVCDEAGMPLYSVGILQDITAIKRAEEELARHQEGLEDLVGERTAELEAKNAELERMNRLFVGRELRIKELRDRVKELQEKLDLI
jgi:PAS domain-containing protein